jgi:hypothetical protein
LYNNEYYHYIDEHLTRLAFVRDFLQKNPDVHLILQAPHKYINQSLKVIGISPKRILPYYSQHGQSRLEPNVFYRVDHLYAVVFPHYAGFASYREVLSKMHKVVIPVELPPFKRKGILLVARHDRPTRHVSNFPELKRAISKEFPEEGTSNK